MSGPHKAVIGHGDTWPGGFLQARRVFPRAEFLLLTLTLYPHQHTGAYWLCERKAGILADEQRLGKTITALTAVDGLDLLRNNSVRTLVVCPTVVLWNWKAEAEKWLDAPRVQIIDNGKVELDREADVVVVTHGLLLSRWILSQLANAKWDALIVDEAHAFKSPYAQRTDALYNTLAPSARYVWPMTGTICPNHAGELYTHLRGLAPERLVFEGKVLTYDRFVDRFCTWRETQYGRKITGNRPDMLPELKERIDGFILRRLMKDIWPDLPRIRFETVHLRPLEMDAALVALNAELAPRVLKALHDPENFASFFDTLKDKEEYARFRRLCGMAKAKPVAEFLHQELLEGGLEKVVVFAHHQDVIKEIACSLARFGVRTITGGTSAFNRRANVEDFQTNPNIRVMVANIIAGGVGVTLNAATEIVFVEQSWTPGDNAQAAKRCDHPDQTRRVRVRFMALADTCDEAVTASNRQKTQMVREVLGE